MASLCAFVSAWILLHPLQAYVTVDFCAKDCVTFYLILMSYFWSLLTAKTLTPDTQVHPITMNSFTV